MLDETGSIIRQELVEKVDDEKLADLLDELPMDDAAEFLFDLPDPISDRLMDLMEELQSILKLIMWSKQLKIKKNFKEKVMSWELRLLRPKKN